MGGSENMNIESGNSRREFMRITTVGAAGLLLTACENKPNLSANNGETEKAGDQAEEVTATEDLMREHGVLRRALLVYAETIPRLRANPSSLAPDALLKTARLFRSFGEDYHEKKLEETYIFPAVTKAGGAAAALPDILIAQHTRGREITDYVIASTQGAKLGATNVEPLARALETFVRMYQHHAAREDTIIFPAWKASLSAEQLDEMGEKFEDIEHQQFGEDGYEDAVKQIGEIEGSLGLADLAQFTAPPPPRTSS
jgi:hemerythrin-like domain-containing protein